MSEAVAALRAEAPARIRVQVHVIKDGSCTVYEREMEGAPWAWECADKLLNWDLCLPWPGRREGEIATPLPERPVGELCSSYHIYADGRGLVHDG